MSGGFTSLGQVLKLLDMTPHKKGKRTFIEKLPSAQNLDGGNLSSLMGNLFDRAARPACLRTRSVISCRRFKACSDP